MLKEQFFSSLAGISLVVLSANDAGAADACATLAGVWEDASNQWNLYQDSNGGISGTMINDSPTNVCPGSHVWTVTGQLNNNGSFAYTAQYSLPLPRPESCAATITLTGSITKPGCNNSTGTWVNSAPRTGVFSLHTNCRIPTETTPQFESWGSDDNATVAKFEQDLTPNSFNYGGRYVQEFFLADTTDTCYFSGSDIPELITMPAKPRINIANQQPSGYADYVGMTEYAVNYYRSQNRSPCGYYLKQRVKIDCDYAEVVYQVNDLEASQDPFEVFSKRGASARVHQRWGKLPPRDVAIFNTIINWLLEN